MTKKKNNHSSNNDSVAQQLSLGLEIEIERTVKDIKVKEAEYRSQSTIYTEIPIAPTLPRLILPRRYEVLEAEARVRGVQLRPLVRPVQDALTDISREIRLVKETRMGRLYIINGVTGSGKTTFLRSLSLFLDGVSVYTMRDITLGNRADIENALALLARKREEISIVVLEGRELPGSIKETEMEVLLTTLNSDFRNDEGRQTLFVIPTTAPSLAQNISQRASSIGGMTSREKPFFVFSGPKRSKYIDITNETLAAFNESRILVDYGISDDLAKGIAETAESIGQFIESCHQEILSRRDKLEYSASLVKHKRIHLWMVFCSSEDDLRRNHDIVRSLTISDNQFVQVQRIMGSGAKEVREWLDRTAEFAQAAYYLDLRVMYLPVRVATTIFSAHAPDELKSAMKSAGHIQREAVPARAQESLSNTAIGAFLSGNGFKDDPSRRGKLEEHQKELFQEIMKIATKDETILNALIAETIRNWTTDPEVKTVVEVPLNDQASLITDIAVISPTDIYCLEMKWRSSSLTDSEVIRETVLRVTEFVKELPELRHLLPPH